MLRFMAVRIRKDAGELTLEDFESSPIWSFCLGEEHIEGQTECTVRPLCRPWRSIDPRTCDALVTSDFTAASGRRFVGFIVVQVNEYFSPYAVHPSLVLSKPVRYIIDHPLAKRWNQILWESSPRVNLTHTGPIPSDEAPDGVEMEIRTLLGLAYAALDMSPAALFPLTCRPRVKIRGWPRVFSIPGFLRRAESEPGGYVIVH